MVTAKTKVAQGKSKQSHAKQEVKAKTSAKDLKGKKGGGINITGISSGGTVWDPFM